MNKLSHFYILALLPIVISSTSCGRQEQNKITERPSSQNIISKDYKEGNDYFLFERVRVLDKTGFENGAEAYSILLPKGWKHESDVVWNMPETSCAGTFSWLKASSPDGASSLELFPTVIYNWNTNQQVMQMSQGSSSPYCNTGQPMDAEQYLRNVFGPTELGNPEVVEVTQNPLVVKEMEVGSSKAIQEIMQYGAAEVKIHPSGINATVKWADGSEGLVVLGVSVMETTVPNIYNGTFSMIYTTQVSKRIVFKYPKKEKEQAINQFAVTMGSLRSNEAYSNTVNNYWRDIRQKKHVAHVGRIRMMDEQTRAMGNAAIAKGQARLNEMDRNMRSWEQQQNSQDRMHTDFIKTIREVENYQDASGVVELSSSYDHAWSRGDGSSYIMSNNPNFDPAATFQDQNWQEMKKVE